MRVQHQGIAQHVQDAQPAEQRHHAGLSRTAIAGILLLTLSVLFATLPLMLMVINAHQESGAIDDHTLAVEQLAKQEAEQELQEAHAYNANIFAHGSRALGEVSDPWASSGVTLSQTDSDYQHQLDIPADGIMATIRYPRLGINLPIRHGTGDTVLSSGAGHVYGTSLPVGGSNTHAVISAHSGYDRLMFDALSMGQARKGDYFYITVLGTLLSYRVSDIQIIEPDDFTHFAITAGRDEVTLLTCTPYGVNTKRLIVTGERVGIPPAPNPDTVPAAHPQHWLIIGVIIAWLLFILFVIAFVMKHRKEREVATPVETSKTQNLTRKAELDTKGKD